MKERPILFSAPMVRAILDGTKTQTRRVVNAKHLPWLENSVLNFLDGKWNQRPLPYGQPGDRLWVREAWRTVAEADAIPPRDMDEAFRLWFEVEAPHQPGAGKCRPPMFMPRWASRITLEITSVRVERLQDISEADAIEEGIEKSPSLGKPGAFQWCDYRVFGDPSEWFNCPIRSYRSLWQVINGPGSWEANPWVWVVQFKKVDR